MQTIFFLYLFPFFQSDIGYKCTQILSLINNKTFFGAYKWSINVN